MTDDWQLNAVSFGARVRARRKHLKFRQDRVPDGPSSTYMSRIELGTLDEFTPETIDKLASGLKWSREAIVDVLLGKAAIESLPVEDESRRLAIPGTLPGHAGGYQLELDQARADFEAALLEVDAAEARVDHYLYLQARMGVAENAVYEAKMQAEERGQELTTEDRMRIAEAALKDEDEILRLIATTSGVFTAGTRTARERELLDRFYGAGDMPDDHILEFRLRDSSDVDDRVAPAADDLSPEGDLPVGGSSDSE